MILVFAVSAFAHFAMIIPSKDVVTKGDSKDIGLLLQFTHPFEGGPLMQMDKPEKFGVVTGETLTDLLGTLHEKKVDGRSTWETDIQGYQTGGLHFFSAARSLLGTLRRQIHSPRHEGYRRRFRGGRRLG